MNERVILKPVESDGHLWWFVRVPDPGFTTGPFASYAEAWMFAEDLTELPG
jgi:hypothetical protein